MSISRDTLKRIKSLQQKKSREEHNEFVVEGVKMVNELKSAAIQIKAIYSTNEKSEFIHISSKDLERISSLKTPNKMLAVCKIPFYDFNFKDLEGKLTLVLDDIKDPGNLGTIIRIADWFGIENIIASSETVDAFNPKVIQSSMGSIFRVKVHYVDLNSILSKTKLPVFGSFMEGDLIQNVGKVSEGLLVIGNESTGISETLEQFISKKITIPSFGKAESLNAAVATGIICSYLKS